MPEYSDYAGSDPDISLTLALFNVLEKHNKIDFEKSGLQFVRDLLNEQRKAKFATSEKVNEITKMGGQRDHQDGSSDAEGRGRVFWKRC